MQEYKDFDTDSGYPEPQVGIPDTADLLEEVARQNPDADDPTDPEVCDPDDPSYCEPATNAVKPQGPSDSDAQYINKMFGAPVPSTEDGS